MTTYVAQTGDAEFDKAWEAFDASIKRLLEIEANDRQFVRWRISKDGKTKRGDKTYEDLPKECGCCTHIGPHWLHMATFDRRENLEYIKKASKSAEAAWWALYTFAHTEGPRLARLCHEMKSAQLPDGTTLGPTFSELDIEENQALNDLHQAVSKLTGLWYSYVEIFIKDRGVSQNGK